MTGKFKILQPASTPSQETKTDKTCSSNTTSTNIDCPIEDINIHEHTNNNDDHYVVTIPTCQFDVNSAKYQSCCNVFHIKTVCAVLSALFTMNVAYASVQLTTMLFESK